MQKSNFKRAFSIAISALMLLAAFMAPIAQMGVAYAYSTLPYTYYFEEVTGTPTNQKVIKMVFDKGRTVSDITKGDVTVDDEYAAYSIDVNKDADTGGIEIAFDNLGKKETPYVVTFPAGSITFSDGYKQAEDYEVKFTAEDLNPGMDVIFVDDTDFLKSDVLEYNTFYDVEITQPGKKISAIKVAHTKADPGNPDSKYITSVIVTGTSEVEKMKIEFVNMDASNFFSKEEYMSEGRNAGEFISSIVGISDETIEMTLTAYDEKGKVLKEEEIKMITDSEGANMSALPTSEDVSMGLGDLLEGDDGEFEKFLESIDGLEDVKVSYTNSRNTRKVSDVNNLAEVMIDNDVKQIIMDDHITSKADLEFARAATDKLHIDGKNKTYNGKLTLGTCKEVLVENLNVTGDITVNVGATGTARFENVTVDGVKIESSDDLNCVHFGNDVRVTNLEIANTMDVKVVIEEGASVANTAIHPSDDAHEVTLVDETSAKGAFGDIEIDKPEGEEGSYAPTVILDGVQKTEITYGDNMSDADQTNTGNNVDDSANASDGSDGSEVVNPNEAKLEFICDYDNDENKATVKGLKDNGGLELEFFINGSGATWNTSKRADIRTALKNAIDMDATNDVTTDGIDDVIDAANISFAQSNKAMIVKLPTGTAFDTAFAYSNYKVDGTDEGIADITVDVADAGNSDEELATALGACMNIEQGFTIVNGKSLESDVDVTVEASIDFSTISIASAMENGDDVDVTLNTDLGTNKVEYIVGINTKVSDDSWVKIDGDAFTVDNDLFSVSAGDMLFLRQVDQDENVRVIGEVEVKVLPTVKVTGLAFTDTDTDADEMGGNVTWTKAGDETEVTHYVIYASADGTARTTKLGEVAVGTETFSVGADTALAHSIIVVAKNADGEALVANQVIAAVTDVAIPTAKVTGLAFTDTDTNADKMGGNVTWTKAGDETGVTNYVIYASADGTARTTKLGEVAVGTETFSVGADTALAHSIIVVAKNADGEAAVANQVSVAVTDVTS